MVHNDLIGGGLILPGNMIGAFNDSDYELTSPITNQDNSFYDQSSSPTDGDDMNTDFLRGIPSGDLMHLDGEQCSTGLHYSNEEAFQHFVNSTDLLNDLPKLVVVRPDVHSINTFPNLEEHDQAGLSFELMLNPNIAGKGSWYYSSKLCKVFIRMDQTFYMQVVYLSRPDNDNLNLRVMMVFLDDIGLPVKRCNNHKHSDPSVTEEAIMESVIRSENSNALYQGTANGKNVNDRLSVLIPLSVVKPDEKNFIKQSIALKFVCQNSCIGRRPTAVILTLENHKGEVLGKRFVNVKICSCPKRDKEKEETKASELKRTASEANLLPGKKLAKILKIKDEPDVSPYNPQFEPENDANDEGFKLEIRMPNAESMDFILKVCFGHITGLMALDPNNQKYAEYFKFYKGLMDQKKSVQNVTTT